MLHINRDRIRTWLIIGRNSTQISRTTRIFEEAMPGPAIRLVYGVKESNAFTKYVAS